LTAPFDRWSIDFDRSPIWPGGGLIGGKRIVTINRRITLHSVQQGGNLCV
jgi:hypothetical protein